MHSLSKPNSPLATKFHRKMWICACIASFFGAYAFWYIAAVIAKAILK